MRLLFALLLGCVALFAIRYVALRWAAHRDDKRRTLSPSAGAKHFQEKNLDE